MKLINQLTVSEKTKLRLVIAAICLCFVIVGYMEGQDIDRACAAGLARCE